MTEIVSKIEKWAEERNFFGEGGADKKGQFVKLIEEAGELAGNIARNRDCRDDLGDMGVVLIILAKLSGTNFLECLEIAYEDIKDRKGEWINGMFVKQQDL